LSVLDAITVTDSSDSLVYFPFPSLDECRTAGVITIPDWRVFQLQENRSKYFWYSDLQEHGEIEESQRNPELSNSVDFPNNVIGRFLKF